MDLAAPLVSLLLSRLAAVAGDRYNYGGDNRHDKYVFIPMGSWLKSSNAIPSFQLLSQRPWRKIALLARLLLRPLLKSLPLTVTGREAKGSPGVR